VLSESLTLGEQLADPEPLGLTLVEGDVLIDADGLIEIEADALADIDELGLSDSEGEPDIEAEGDALPLGEGEIEALALLLADLLGEDDPLGEGEPDGLVEAEANTVLYVFPVTLSHASVEVLNSCRVSPDILNNFLVPSDL